MRKLYYYFWVSPDFETNIAIKIHEICLKKYLHVFDELTFIAAVDDYSKANNDSSRAIRWIEGICCGRKYNLRIVDNIAIRESRLIYEDIMPSILKKDDDLVFVCHSKGITDVNMNIRNKYSVLRWVISMYYYSLEHISDVEDKLKNGYSAYGSLLTHFQVSSNVAIQNHNKFYIGNFYWINPHSAYENLLFKNVPSEFNNRFLAENFPMLLREESLASYKMACTESDIADLYYLAKEYWPAYLSYYGDSDILYKIQNEIITEICGEEGY